MDLHIRDEAAGDHQSIDGLQRAAFLHHPHSRQTEHLIVARLREAGAATLSLVAEERGGATLIGHLVISPVRIAQVDGWYGLGPVAIAPAWQGRGAGSALVRAALARLRHQQARGCVVLGDPAYYGRFGFGPSGGLYLEGLPPEYFQAIAWQDAPWPDGPVHYHPAFS